MAAMAGERFDGILIDFYGTVTGGDRAAVERVCRRVIDTCHLPLTPGQFAITWGERFFRTLNQSNHERFRTLYECEQVSLRDTLAGFGRWTDLAPLLADLEDYWRNPPIHDDALELLGALDLPICCVSNADTKPLMAAIEKHRLPFDEVISSEDARCYKPQGRIFKLALDALGVRPERAMHIGDSLHSDMAGAARAGIHSTWIRRDDRIHDIGSIQPDCTVTNLTAVHDLL